MSDFDQQAAIEFLRPGWPGLTDAELEPKAAVFEEQCDQMAAGTSETMLAAMANENIFLTVCPETFTAAAAEL